ncbi:hypothetical protein [Sphingosinicella xenopeptidilytica]|uniref:Permease n=1 Tax=Sphingosinicella xenopeptidilytica TaxID=364098 RepID=A0ABW3C5X2_SPHXN
MIIGHYGLAAAVKAREPSIPLWVLMLATVWMDVVFIPFLAVGVEWIERVPGAPHYGGLTIHADYTHSLVGAALLAVALACPSARKWGARSGLLVGALALSHWFLDVIVHRDDLPLLPGSPGGLPKFGFGLWTMPEAALALEILIFAMGMYAYWRAATNAALAGNVSRCVATRSAFKAIIFGAIVVILDVTGLVS